MVSPTASNTHRPISGLGSLAIMLTLAATAAFPALALAQREGGNRMGPEQRSGGGADHSRSNSFGGGSQHDSGYSGGGHSGHHRDHHDRHNHRAYRDRGSNFSLSVSTGSSYGYHNSGYSSVSFASWGGRSHAPRYFPSCEPVYRPICPPVYYPPVYYAPVYRPPVYYAPPVYCPPPVIVYRPAIPIYQPIYQPVYQPVYQPEYQRAVSVTYVAPPVYVNPAPIVVQPYAAPVVVRDRIIIERPAQLAPIERTGDDGTLRYDSPRQDRNGTDLPSSLSGTAPAAARNGSAGQRENWQTTPARGLTSKPAGAQGRTTVAGSLPQVWSARTAQVNAATRPVGAAITQQTSRK